MQISFVTRANRKIDKTTVLVINYLNGNFKNLDPLVNSKDYIVVERRNNREIFAYFGQKFVWRMKIYDSRYVNMYWVVKSADLDRP